MDDVQKVAPNAKGFMSGRDFRVNVVRLAGHRFDD
jgi:hypothetical protein